jgi:hypothetical protein
MTERYKEQSEWSAHEWFTFNRDGTRPESDEYREAKRTALEDAGLESDDDTATPVDEMSVEQHLERMRQR